MLKVVEDAAAREELAAGLDAIVREGARRMLAIALEAEVEAYIAAHTEERTGLSDGEYFWEPAPGGWSVRPRGMSTAPIQAGSGEFTIDFEFPEPDPPPVTSISWRLGHLIVGVLGARTAAHFGGPPVDYLS